MRYKVFYGVIWLALVVVSLLFGSVADADTDVFLVPPSIMPVVILRGSEYEIGYQYGQQVAELIALKKDLVWAETLSRQPSRKTVLHDLKAWQFQIKKFVPNLVPFMQGIANGATEAGYDLKYHDVLLINVFVGFPGYYHYPSDAEKLKLRSEEEELYGCFTFAAWGSCTADGSLIAADSFDGPFQPQVAIVAFPKQGNNYLTVCDAGELSNHPSMNNKGLFIGQAGGSRPGSPFNDVDPPDISQLLCDWDYGIDWRLAFKQLAQFNDNANDSVSMLMKWPIPNPENYCFSDVNGNAFNVEATAAVKCVRKAGDYDETDFIYTGNGYFNADMVPEEVKGLVQFVEHAGYGSKLRVGMDPTKDYTIARNLMAWNMLHNYHGHVDIEFAKMMWRFPGPSSPEWKTTVIGRSSNEHIVVAKPDNGDNGIAYICTGPVALEMYPNGWSPAISGTHSFFKLNLAATPQEVVNKARSQARSDSRTAYRMLMALKFSDPGYQVVNDLPILLSNERVL